MSESTPPILFDSHIPEVIRLLTDIKGLLAQINHYLRHQHDEVEI